MEVDQLKHKLLDKLISLEDEDILRKVDLLFGNVDLQKTEYKVSERQREMLSLSEADIEYDRMTSNDDLNREEEKWLNG